jgi:hypothetical protein
MKEILKKLNACDPAIEWVADRTIEQAVADCYRGDWLLWLAARLEIDNRKLTLAKGMCANTARHLMKDEQSINAVDAAIAYGKGEIGNNELANAAAAANAAAYADDDAYAAAAYAYAAAAANAVNAAAYAANAAAAKKENQKQTADICREILGEEIITKFNQL